MASEVARDDGVLAWLGAIARGAGADDSARALLRDALAESGAERAFFVRADERGVVLGALGLDLDGIDLADAEKRIDPTSIEVACRGDAPLYQREVATAGGTGARLLAPAPRPASGARALVVVEHRFVPGRFDAVSGAIATRWSLLAGVVTRLDAIEPTSSVRSDVAPAREPLASRAPAVATTAVPVREAKRQFPSILGESVELRRALARLDLAIESDLPVLVVGETGTGKELFARALHDFGARAPRPFVAINCGAVPEALFEAELFGHARGSFTGAERARPGLIARAEGGTLLLDEIGELPLSRQAVLLRALESRRYRAVGSDEERPFDVRIVAATNRDLEKAVEEKTFRRDLLYRLNAIEVHVPPLRERVGDVPLLARAFLTRAGSRATLSSQAIAALAAYDWPGNVRELEHQMQRLAAVGASKLEIEHLPRPIRARASIAPTPVERPAERGDEHEEREAVRRALAKTGGNLSRAAELLGITRHGLKKRMVRLGMRAPARAGERE